jgi:hypothetical protein
MRVADYKQLRVYKLAFESAKMMDDARSWHGSRCELREKPAKYFVGVLDRDGTLERSDAPEVRCPPISYRQRSPRNKPTPS